MRIRSRATPRAGVFRALALLACAAAIAAAGCSKKPKEEPPPGAGQTPGTQQAPTASPPAAGAAGTATPPAGTTPKGIWAQIENEHAQLDAAIRNRKLGEAHQHADTIRDLVVAAAGNSQDLDAPDAAKLQAIVTGVGAVAAKLDKASDKGDLKLVQEHFAALQRQLSLLDGMLNKH